MGSATAVGGRCSQTRWLRLTQGPVRARPDRDDGDQPSPWERLRASRSIHGTSASPSCGSRPSSTADTRVPRSIQREYRVASGTAWVGATPATRSSEPSRSDRGHVAGEAEQGPSIADCHGLLGRRRVRRSHGDGAGPSGRGASRRTSRAGPSLRCCVGFRVGRSDPCPPRLLAAPREGDGWPASDAPASDDGAERRGRGSPPVPAAPPRGRSSVRDRAPAPGRRRTPRPVARRRPRLPPGRGGCRATGRVIAVVRCSRPPHPVLPQNGPFAQRTAFHAPRDSACGRRDQRATSRSDSPTAPTPRRVRPRPGSWAPRPDLHTGRSPWNPADGAGSGVGHRNATTRYEGPRCHPRSTPSEVGAGAGPATPPRLAFRLGRSRCRGRVAVRRGAWVHGPPTSGRWMGSADCGVVSGGGRHAAPAAAGRGGRRARTAPARAYSRVAPCRPRLVRRTGPTAVRPHPGQLAEGALDHHHETPEFVAHDARPRWGRAGLQHPGQPVGVARLLQRRLHQGPRPTRRQVGR